VDGAGGFAGRTGAGVTFVLFCPRWAGVATFLISGMAVSSCIYLTSPDSLAGSGDWHTFVRSGRCFDFLWWLKIHPTGSGCICAKYALANATWEWEGERQFVVGKGFSSRTAGAVALKGFEESVGVYEVNRRESVWQW
jgi:hypothetical protein